MPIYREMLYRHRHRHSHAIDRIQMLHIFGFVTRIGRVAVSIFTESEFSAQVVEFHDEMCCVGVAAVARIAYKKQARMRSVGEEPEPESVEFIRSMNSTRIRYSNAQRSSRR